MSGRESRRPQALLSAHTDLSARAYELHSRPADRWAFAILRAGLSPAAL